MGSEYVEFAARAFVGALEWSRMNWDGALVVGGVAAVGLLWFILELGGKPYYEV